MKNNILQKQIFLDGEGDNWLIRNLSTKKKILPQKKKFVHQKKNILTQLSKIVPSYKKKKITFLEVGSSSGEFLNLVLDKFKNLQVYGIDPSKKAINQLKWKRKYSFNDLIQEMVENDCK